MSNQLFDHGFLSDFYSDRESMAAPFGRSNVSWCGLLKISRRSGEVQFRSFFPSLIVNGTKTQSCSSDFWNTSRTPYVVFKLNKKLSKC